MAQARMIGGIRYVLLLLAVAVALLTGPASGAFAQATGRAEPVTGPGVTTIGGIAVNARINVRSGPSVVFPVVGTLPYGTRVRKGICVGGGSAGWCEVETLDSKVSGYARGSS